MRVCACHVATASVHPSVLLLTTKAALKTKNESHIHFLGVLPGRLSMNKPRRLAAVVVGAAGARLACCSTGTMQRGEEWVPMRQEREEWVSMRPEWEPLQVKHPAWSLHGGPHYLRPDPAFAAARPSFAAGPSLREMVARHFEWSRDDGGVAEPWPWVWARSPRLDRWL